MEEHAPVHLPEQAPPHPEFVPVFPDPPLPPEFIIELLPEQLFAQLPLHDLEHNKWQSLAQLTAQEEVHSPVQLEQLVLHSKKQEPVQPVQALEQLIEQLLHD